MTMILHGDLGNEGKEKF